MIVGMKEFCLTNICVFRRLNYYNKLEYDLNYDTGLSEFVNFLHSLYVLTNTILQTKCVCLTFKITQFFDLTQYIVCKICTIYTNTLLHKTENFFSCDLLDSLISVLLQNFRLVFVSFLVE